MSTLAKKRKSLKHANIRIGRSHAELILILSLHAVAVLAVFLAAFPVFIQLFIAISLVVSMGRFCHCWRSASAQRLVYKDDEWYIVATTQEHKQVVSACHYWSRFFVVLSIQRKKYWPRRYCALYWDAFSPDDFRHIKLLSRFGFSHK